MATPVLMPQFGFTQEESTIVAWLCAEGQAVRKGDPLCEVTTDKVDMEVEAPTDGVLGGICFAAGDAVPVATVIAYVLAPGERLPTEDTKPAPQAAGEQPGLRPVPGGREGGRPTPVAARIAAAAGLDLEPVSGSGPRGRITRRDVEAYLAGNAGGPSLGPVRATPAARRVAREHGLALSRIAGRGPHGRIQEADALAAAGATKAEPAAPGLERLTGQPEIVPLVGLRGTIARRMQRSYQEAPHISFSLDVDMGAVLDLRNAAGKGGAPAPSLTAVLAFACAWALRRHPGLNSYLQDGEIWRLPRINVGVAVALEEGLIVPVVHDAGRYALRALDTMLGDLVARAREGRLQPEEVAGGTFTLSNLGMFGIDQFTAILNPPQVAILAAGRVARRFVPDEAGNPLARPLMTLTLSVDHRALDGAQAARFLATLRDGLEEPASMLL